MLFYVLIKGRKLHDAVCMYMEEDSVVGDRGYISDSEIDTSRLLYERLY